MKNRFSLFLLILLTGSICFSCSDDNSNPSGTFLTGTWTIVNIVPQAMPVEGGSLTAEALADSLLNYTFLEENSEITFTGDSVSLTALVPGYRLPLTLPYRYHKKILTIHTPYDLPFWIQGTIETTGNVMQFALTPESYISILDFIQPPFRGELLSANITYELQKNE